MTFARKNNVIALACMRLYIYPIFENQPYDVCGHLSEEASKGRFLKPDKLQTHSNEGKGRKRKRKSDGKVKEEKRKKAMAALFVFIIATLEFFAQKKQVKKECLTQKVHLAIKFSKIRPDMYFFIFFFTVLRKSCNNVNPNACSPRTTVKLFFRFFFFNWIAFPSNSSLNQILWLHRKKQKKLRKQVRLYFTLSLQSSNLFKTVHLKLIQRSQTDQMQVGQEYYNQATKFQEYNYILSI